MYPSLPYSRHATRRFVCSHGVFRDICLNPYLFHPQKGLQALVKKPRAVSPKALVVSVAQFRPEKNHALQVEAIQVLLDKYPEHRGYISLVMIGGSRNAGDEARVAALHALIVQHQLQEHVTIATNIAHADVRAAIDFLVCPLFTTFGAQLMDYLGRAVAGLHTMRDEHFGIGVVEFLAAGYACVHLLSCCC
jgi:alpha-1,2-mannosyltransferase